MKLIYHFIEVAQSVRLFSNYNRYIIIRRNYLSRSKSSRFGLKKMFAIKHRREEVHQAKISLFKLLLPFFSCITAAACLI